MSTDATISPDLADGETCVSIIVRQWSLIATKDYCQSFLDCVK